MTRTIADTLQSSSSSFIPGLPRSRRSDHPEWEQIWKKLLEIADRVLVLEKELLEARDGGDE
jgi:hypothetical protein